VQNGGPALATALACYFDFFALLIIFRLRYGRLGIRELVGSFARISLCSGIMGIACWLGARYTRFTMHAHFPVQLVVFAGLLIGATGLYLAMAWVFRCREMEEIYGIATRRSRGGEAYVEA
jgi:peptidoglycan biosynthesis protein MviN/MurJ (putative lipid II flippase)